MLREVIEIGVEANTTQMKLIVIGKMATYICVGNTYSAKLNMTLKRNKCVFYSIICTIQSFASTAIQPSWFYAVEAYQLDE